MECNKDEAIKAMEISEKMFAEMDILGAKKFALKALDMYSALDGLTQFLAILEVYISAEKTINGEADWYAVLGVDPLANDGTIRRRFRKLALILHPDKNKSVGAVGAFKIASEAFSILSDKAKRTLYDQKRNLSGIYENLSKEKTSVPTGQNGSNEIFRNNKSEPWDWRNGTHPKPNSGPHLLKPTFWTVCGSCDVQFEYLRTYLNNNLHCPNCHKPFLAIEIPPPPLNLNHSSAPWISKRNSSPENKMHKSYATAKTEVSDKNLAASGFTGVNSLKRTFQSDTLFGSRNAEIVRKAPFVSKGDKPKKKRCVEENKMHSGSASQLLMNNGGISKENIFRSQIHSSETRRVNFAGNYGSNYRRELSQLEIRNMLMEKAKYEIQKKLNEWRAAAVLTSSEKLIYTDEVTWKVKGVKKARSIIIKDESNNCRAIKDKNSSPAKSSDDSDAKDSDAFSMSVPDPDFHDFDKDRSEKSFGSNQVWAVYDDDDGMPRYYALIHNVISLKPFKMRISWLNSKTNDELAPLNWIGCGFPKTSGDFRIGKHKSNGFLNSFSHKVKFSRGSRGSIQIYPQKGDVWALYRNWSPDWNELTPDEVIHKYDMVKVLEDYNEEKGVCIVPLVKVAGFKTVFKQHIDPSKNQKVPREEMFRFSHQVPSHLLSGLEGHNAPAGCLELDPAATPLDLLQVGKEDQKEERKLNSIEGAQNCNKEELEKSLKITSEILKEVAERKDIEEKKMIVYSRRRLRRSENAGGC